MGSSSAVGLSNAINYPRYTRVINSDVIFAKDNIWLNNHKVRIGGSFSDTARVLNRHSAKTGVKAEVVHNNNVARLKLTSRGRNLAINDPKGIFSSLGKNIGTSDKALVQIVCRGKVSWSYNRPVKHLLTVHNLISEDNKKILNKYRQATPHAHGPEEIEDDLVEIDSDDEQQIVEDDFATNPLSPPSLLLGSAPRFRVVSQMPSLLGEMEDDLVDSGDEQIIEDDFATPSQSRLRGSGTRWSIQSVPSLLGEMEGDQVESDDEQIIKDDFATPSSPPSLLLGSAPRFGGVSQIPSLLGEMEDDLVDGGDEQIIKDDFATPSQSRLRGSGTRWSIQSVPSSISKPSSLDEVEIDPSMPRLDASVTPMKKGRSAVVEPRLRPGPQWSIEQPRSDSFATMTQERDPKVVPSKSAPSRRLKSKPALPVATPPARKHKSIKGRGEAGLDFRAKLTWLRARDPDLPSAYNLKEVFTEEEKLTIISRYEKIKSLQQKLSPAVPPIAPTPVRSKKSKSIKGHGDARRDFTTALSSCRRHDPTNQLYHKISYDKDDRAKIMATYEKLKSPSALSPPVPSLIPLAYSKPSILEQSSRDAVLNLVL